MNILHYTDEYWMDFAFIEAERALDKGEIPVGAVIIKTKNSHIKYLFLNPITLNKIRPVKRTIKAVPKSGCFKISKKLIKRIIEGNKKSFILGLNFL